MLAAAPFLLSPLPMVVTVAAEDRSIQPRFERQTYRSATRRAFSTEHSPTAIVWSNRDRLRGSQRTITQTCHDFGVALHSA
jgi:hypothetical protein